MEALPPNVASRVESLKGASLALLYEPFGRTRVVLFFHPPGQPPLNVVIDVIREARWPFAFYPSLRSTFRFGTPVREVRLALSKSFGGGTPRQSVRIEVDFEGAPPLAFEGEGVTIGPVPPPSAPPAPPRSNTMWS